MRQISPCFLGAGYIPLWTIDCILLARCIGRIVGHCALYQSTIHRAYSLFQLSQHGAYLVMRVSFDTPAWIACPIDNSSLRLCFFSWLLVLLPLRHSFPILRGETLMKGHLIASKRNSFGFGSLDRVTMVPVVLFKFQIEIFWVLSHSPKQGKEGI